MVNLREVLQAAAGGVPAPLQPSSLQSSPVNDASGNASVLTLGPWALLLQAPDTNFPTHPSHCILLPSIRPPDGGSETLSWAFPTSSLHLSWASCLMALAQALMMLPLCPRRWGSRSFLDASPEVTPALSFPPCSKLALASLLNLLFLLGPSSVWLLSPSLCFLLLPSCHDVSPCPGLHLGPACSPSGVPVLASSLSSQPQPSPPIYSTALGVMAWLCQATTPSAPRAPLAGFSSLTVQSPPRMESAMMLAPRWQGLFVFTAGCPAPTNNRVWPLAVAPEPSTTERTDTCCAQGWVLQWTSQKPQF